MTAYILLIKQKGQGIRNVKESPPRVDAVKKAIETSGGKMAGFYLTTGKYDIVAMVEAPSDEVLKTSVTKVENIGNIRTETMKVYVEAKYRDTIAKL